MYPPRYHHNGFVATNSCTWAYNLRLHIAGINELRQEHAISDYK